MSKRERQQKLLFCLEQAKLTWSHTGIRATLEEEAIFIRLLFFLRGGPHFKLLVSIFSLSSLRSWQPAAGPDLQKEVRTINTGTNPGSSRNFAAVTLQHSEPLPETHSSDENGAPLALLAAASDS